MPLHLDAIMLENSRIDFLKGIPEYLNGCEAAFASKDKRIFHLSRWIADESSTLFLETALGLLPTAASGEVFSLNGLAVGKAVAMCADIKADFVHMDYPKRNTPRSTV